jgi:hypothetical protein
MTRRTSLAVLLALAVLMGPSIARGGVVCAWQVASASAPAPASSVLAEVGELVTLTGQFAPSAVVQVAMVRFGVPVSETAYTAEPDGSLVVVRTFTGAEVGNWEIVATSADGLCGPATVFASIFPTGGSTEVTVKTDACAPSVQTAADYARHPEACDGVVLPADYPAPPGRTVVGLRALAHGYDLTDANAVLRPFSEAQLVGTGTCDMTIRECTYDYGYRWTYVPFGPTSVAAVPAPPGFRLGTVQVVGGGGSPVIGDASVGFDTTGGASWEIRFVWFAPPAPPSPRPPAPGGLMPDTSITAGVR